MAKLRRGINKVLEELQVQAHLLSRVATEVFIASGLVVGDTKGCSHHFIALPVL
jgi:hypothetical protein